MYHSYLLTYEKIKCDNLYFFHNSNNRQGICVKKKWPCFLFNKDTAGPEALDYSTEVTCDVFGEGVLAVLFLLWWNFKQKEKKRKWSFEIYLKKHRKLSDMQHTCRHTCAWSTQILKWAEASKTNNKDSRTKTAEHNLNQFKK